MNDNNKNPPNIQQSIVAFEIKNIWWFPPKKKKKILEKYCFSYLLDRYSDIPTHFQLKNSWKKMTI